MLVCSAFWRGTLVCGHLKGQESFPVLTSLTQTRHPWLQVPGKNLGRHLMFRLPAPWSMCLSFVATIKMALISEGKWWIWLVVTHISKCTGEKFLKSCKSLSEFKNSIPSDFWSLCVWSFKMYPLFTEIFSYSLYPQHSEMSCELLFFSYIVLGTLWTLSSISNNSVLE